jgi:hypothetical protein
MSGAHTVWHILDEHRASDARRRRIGVLLAAALLCVMATAEVMVLRSAVGSDGINLIATTLLG